MVAYNHCRFLLNLVDIKTDDRINEALRMATSHYEVWVLGIACYLRNEDAVAN